MSIKEKTEELGYSITEMATTGETAGGCLAMLYAYRNPNKSPIPIKFVFQMSGPATFIPELWGSTDTESAADFVTMMYGETVTSEMIENGKTSKLINEISPAAYVNKTTVPTIIAYGSKDKVVPTGLKEQLIQAFNEYDVTYKFIEFPNSGHTMALDKDKTQAYFEAVEEYLKLYFENN
ncbi:MAG: prolyl oligopeptidase family serine peptidase [Clostridia bacterium]|nr:prolyl oligopeptidase family serine peptidase [Clostridia bacterium]